MICTTALLFAHSHSWLGCRPHDAPPDVSGATLRAKTLEVRRQDPRHVDERPIPNAGDESLAVEGPKL